MVIIFFLLIIILFIVFTFCSKQYNSAALRGQIGEWRVSAILAQLPNEYTVLNNLVFPTKKGTTQIDHVVVSKYGIFAIETKNYRGEIYGDDKRREWTQLIVTRKTYMKKWWKTYSYVTKKRFYNPVKQSLGHALTIKELLSAFPHIRIIPIVVFTGDAILSHVESRYVVYETNLLDVINQYKTIYLTNNDVQAVVNILERNNVRNTVSDEQHVMNLQVAASNERAAILSGICPKCGGRLLERNGRYGIFYGCSNYPKCRFTVRN